MLSGFFLFKAGFLTIQHFVILPSDQPFYAYAQSNQATAPTSASASQSSNQNQLPTQLDIPTQKISLPIIPSSLVNGEWQVTTQGVSLLTPDQTGNPAGGFVLFGHDWPILLGRMRQASIGQTVSLSYANGKRVTYVITSIFKVSPNQTDILKMTKPDTILIYTCSDFLDSQRFVVLAQLQ